MKTIFPEKPIFNFFDWIKWIHSRKKIKIEEKCSWDKNKYYKK